MSFLGFGRKIDEQIDEQIDEELTTDEADGDEQIDEDFEPFVCRKCGQTVTNPFERCEVAQA